MPDHQLSLAIGKEGQNARLAARLSGYRIDIRSESQDLGLDIEEDEEQGAAVAETPTEEIIADEIVADETDEAVDADLEVDTEEVPAPAEEDEMVPVAAVEEENEEN